MIGVCVGGCSHTTCMFPTENRVFIQLTSEGESLFLDSRKALLLSGSRSKSAVDKSMMREWSF